MPCTWANANRQPFDVWVGRGGPFGNPIKPGLYRCPECADPHPTPVSTLPCFMRYFARRLILDPAFRARVHQLHAKTLGCPCGARGPCHAKLMARYVQEHYPDG